LSVINNSLFNSTLQKQKSVYITTFTGLGMP